MVLAEAPVPSIDVELAFSPLPRQVLQAALTLLQGATVLDAVHASGFLLRRDGFTLQALEAGELGLSIWGRRVPLTHILRDADRVEVCRALQIDPKEARRARHLARHRAR